MVVLEPKSYRRSDLELARLRALLQRIDQLVTNSPTDAPLADATRSTIHALCATAGPPSTRT